MSFEHPQIDDVMPWHESHRADAEALPVADRHYNRQKPGTPQFVPPGRCIVLKHLAGGSVAALWVTSWPYAQFVKHEWAGAWVNSCFRKECDGEASSFIRAAVAATRAQAMVEPKWEGGRIPDLGMVTFIDPKHVRPRVIRSRPTWGHSYLEAGFKHVGYTKAGLWAFQLLPADMPEPREIQRPEQLFEQSGVKVDRN